MQDVAPVVPPAQAAGTASTIEPRPGVPWLNRLTWLMVIGSLAWAIWSAWTQDETYDEPMHLEWSRRLYEEGETERVSNPLYNSKTPVSLLNVWARKQAKEYYQGRTRELLFAARLPTVAWLLVLLLTTYGLARALLDSRGASLATLLVAADPNLVAHGSLVTVDVPYAAATLLTMAAALWFAARPGVVAAGALGAALGMAFAIKYSAVLLLFSLLFLPLAWRQRPRWNTLVLMVLVAAAACCVVIDAAYLFQGVARPLGDVTWKSPIIRAVVDRSPFLTLPLPIDFLSGLDSVIGTERHRGWPVIVLGELHPRGVWYYFLVQWVVKTPLGILAALLTGFWMVRHVLRLNGPLQFLVAALLVHLIYFSFIFRTQIGYRYVLMCIPPAAIVAAAGLATRLTARGIVLVAGGLVGVCALEAVPYLDNPLAYTNAAVQPKRNVYRLIADSSIHWGQNDGRVIAELERRGIHGHVNPAHILPGTNIIGLNYVAGVTLFERYRWVREHLQPVGHVGHTYLIYEVTPEQYARFVEAERVVEPIPSDGELCAAARENTMLEGARPITLAAPDGPIVPVVCVRAHQTADLEWDVSGGRIIINRVGQRLRAGERMHAGQRLVFRLRPGVYAFVISRQAQLTGQWVASGVSIGFASADLRVVLAPAPPGA